MKRETITDDSGRFVIDSIDSGSYSIEVNDRSSSALLFKTGIGRLAHDTTVRLSGTLRPFAVLKGSVGQSVWTSAVFCLVTGLERRARLDSSGGFTIADLPAGTFSLRMVSTDASFSSVAVDSVIAESGATTRLPFIDWRFSKQLAINTTASGANVMGNVTGFPVLVRLTNSNFNFSQAGEGGNDLRFSKVDGTPLQFEIERWDAGAGAAEAWVKVDTILGNNNSQYIVMYWGAPLVSAASLSNSATVFDTAHGFQGVWHMGQPGNTTAYDATANRYNGTPYGMAASSAVPGMIGTAQKFDGTSSYIQMTGTGASKLSFPENGTYTVSAWVCVDSPATHPALIVGKGHTQYYLRMNYYTLNRYWEFVEYHDADQQQNITDVPATQAYSWKYMVGIRQGGVQHLYINGELVMDTIRLYPYNNGVTARNTSYDVTIGKHLEPFATEGDCYLKGIIDEVRIANVATSPDWIKLCYMNQRKDDKLVLIK